jgi:multiple sugar transport system ATP-binding protein
MVFQNYALYPYLTVEDNIGFPLKIARVKKPVRAARVREVAKMLGLEEYLARKPGQLSGGQRQRVAMGRAIVRDPAVFLFDEPLSNLDAELRSRLRSAIKKLHQKLRATVVYVTHDQVEAMTLADRIVIMNKGKVEQVGTPTDVYAAPANLFVAGFIGSPAMNMIPAEVVAHADGPHVIAAGASLPLGGCGDMACAPGARATFGVRPEDISLVPPGAAAPATVDARVTIVEPLGPEFLLSFALNGHEIMAKIAGRALPRVGENLRFAFNMAHAHLFDAATGQSLRR